MNDIEKRARELLAAEYADYPELAEGTRMGRTYNVTQAPLRAIIAALTPPEGYVLVPVEPTEAMIAEAWKYGFADDAPDPVYSYRAMLAAHQKELK